MSVLAGWAQTAQAQTVPVTSIADIEVTAGETKKTARVGSVSASTIDHGNEAARPGGAYAAATPTVLKIERKTPSASPTAQDSVKWRVEFNTNVKDVTYDDFTVSGTTATLAVAGEVFSGGTSKASYIVTASGGDLAGLDGTVTLGFASGQDIKAEIDDSVLENTTPSLTNDNTFVVDNTEPRVASITRQKPTDSPTAADTLTWRITFSESVMNVESGAFTLAVVPAPTNAPTHAVAVIGIDSVDWGGSKYAYSKKWDVTVSGGDLPTLDATVTLTIGGSIADLTLPADYAAGEANLLTNFTPTGTNDNTFVVDNSPSVAITDVPATTNGAFTATFTFSAAVTGFVVGDITLTGATASAFTETVTGTAWTASITPTADYSVSVAADVAINADSLGNKASDTESGTYDNTAPTVSITRVPALTNKAITALFTFSETVSDFVVGDITLVNATASAFTNKKAGEVWEALITPSGNYSVSVAANAAEDAAGNGNDASDVKTGTYDATSPTVTITGVPATATGAFTATFTFSELVNGFVVGDITLAGAAASAFTKVSITTWTALITPSANYSVSVAAGVVRDKAKNSNTASATKSGTYTPTVPMVTITGVRAATNAAFTATFTFSETVTGFVVGDITLANATASAFTVKTSGTAWTALITPTAEGTYSVSVAADVATDADSNGNTASAVASGAYDTTAPMIGISGVPATTTSIFTATFTFSEAISDFVVGDITLVNANAANFTNTVTGTTWTARIAPVASGTYSVSVAAGAATDAAGNGSTVSSTKSGTFAKTNPRVTSITRQDPATALTNADVLTWRVTFDEDVRYVVPRRFTVVSASGRTLALETVGVEAVSNSKSVYDLTVSGGGLKDLTAAVFPRLVADVDGDNIEDLDGNPLDLEMVPDPKDYAYVLDNTAPTVTISGVPATATGAFTATFTFSEMVNGFIVDHITLVNAAASAFTKVSLTTWTVLITPSGNYSVSVAAGVATDKAKNDNTVSATKSGTYTSTVPSVTITGVRAATNAAFTATFTFSETVTGFVVGDITLAGATASAFTNTVMGTTWTALIAPTAEGAYSVSVAANVATDADSNGNTASAVASGAYDTTAPTIDIAGVPATTTSMFTATFTFSEAVKGFAAGDITLVNATAANFTETVTGTIWTALITPTAEGTYSVSVAADAAKDAAGNGNPLAAESGTYADLRRLTFNPASLSATEDAGSGSVTVVLDAQPSGTVTVALATSDATVFTVDDAKLTFTTVNWAEAQTVKLTIIDDAIDNASNRSATLTATPSGGGYTAAATLSVRLTDDDDETEPGNRAPAFDSWRYAFDLAENTPGPVSLDAVAASDPDGDAPVYSLWGDVAAVFSIDGDGTVSYTGSGEDYEAAPGSHEFWADVTDGRGLWAMASVTVTVTNVNEAPVFAERSYAFDLAENTPGPASLGGVSATDPDAGDAVEYSLAGDGAAVFWVDADGTVSYTGGGEDFESGPGSYRLTATGADARGLTAAVPLTVTVTDANEAPVFANASYAFDLAESAPGPVSLGDVAASDPDAGDALAYSLAGDGAAMFSVDTDGTVSYSGGGEDFESGPGSYEFIATVADAGGLSAAVPLTVTVTDANEVPAFAEPSYTFDLAENVPGPFSLGGVSASDPDSGDALAYSLAGDGAAQFSVDTDGTVSYTGGGEDFESGPGGYELAATATDASGLSASVPLIVTVTDANEVPAFAEPGYTFDLAENMPGPFSLGGVAASDPDGGDALAYSLAGDGAAQFSVDTDGTVSYTGGGEDFESGPGGYELAATATDASGLSATVPVTVTVTDVNEAPLAAVSIPPKVLDAYGASSTDDLSGFFHDADGDALAYAAVSSLSGVATADLAGSQLTVRPLAIGVTTVTVTASDPGGLSAIQSLTVTVEASQADRARSVKLSLAAFGRTVGTETVEAIAGRLGSGPAGPRGSHARVGGRSLSCGAFSEGEACGWGSLVGGASRLLGLEGVRSALSNGPEGFVNMLLPGGFADAGGSENQPGMPSPSPSSSLSPSLPSLRGSPVSREALLSETSFQFSAGGPQDQGGSAGGFTLWGRASAGGFEGSPEDGFTMSGRTRSAYLGGDYRFSAGTLAGVALSGTSGSIDFSSDVNGEGTLEPRMLGVHPYVQWSPAAGLDIWGLAGAGRGSADLAETQGGTFATGLSMIMGAMGARQTVTGGFALKADAFSVRIISDAAANLAGVAADARRIRLAPEISGVWGSGASSFRSSLEVGARMDGGDAETGMGAEAAGTFGYDHAGAGISLEARGRTLLVHQDEDFSEWGASVSFQIRPGGDEGLSLSVAPEWGGKATGTDALWQGGAAFAPALGSPDALGAHTGWSPRRLKMEARYVLPVAGSGRFEPFGRWSQDGGDGYRLNAGIRLSTADVPGSDTHGARLIIDISGEQRASGVSPGGRWFALRGKIAFD